ncbi:MAG: hypothetical protein C7N36_06045 [Bacteroidetes bacterium]|nr:MAG: hypothetical protein C7N36_06045 [Bacteroidota bacterium]
MRGKLPKANINEQRYRVLIDNAPEVVLIFDVESGRFIDANRAAIRLLKFTREELFQLGPSDISPTLYKGAAAADKAQEYILHALNGGNPAFEWVHIDRDGLEIPCEIRLIRIPPYDKSVVRASIIDLTEKKKMEAELAESEERLKLALKATGLGCYDWFPQENRLHWDKGMHDLFGLDPADPIDRNEFFFQCLHPDDKAQAQQNFQTTMDPKNEQLNIASNYRIIRHGRVAHLSSIGVIMRTAQGEVQRIIGTVQDITSIKKNAEALRQAKNYAENLIETANVIVVGLDRGGTINIFNKAAQAITGYSQEELTGKNWFETLVPRDRYPQVWKMFTSLAKKEELPRTFENPILTKTGEERIISWQNSALYDHDEHLGTISFGIDITQRKQIEETLRDREKRFQISTHAAQLGIWDWDIEHNHLLWDETMTKIYELPKRELALVDCTTLIQQIINDLSSQINTTQATIKVDPLPQIKGYETELRMLFQNLISNAIKFRKSDQHPLIQLGVQEEKKQWIFSVKDEGIGIDPIYQDQIFVLFQRLHGREEYEGTGIGLAHCQKIVDLHGGNIWVESEADKGSTFFFSIAKSERALD